MRKAILAMAVGAAMWAGQAQAAFLEYRFDVSMSGFTTDPNEPPFPLTTYNKAFATFYFTVDLDQIQPPESDGTLRYFASAGGFWDYGIARSGALSFYRELIDYSAPEVRIGISLKPGAPSGFANIEAGDVLGGTARFAWQPHYIRYEYEGSLMGFGSRLLDAPERNLGFSVGRLETFVPEPSTWAMLIAGFGLVGGAIRRRYSACIARASMRTGANTY